MTEQNTQQKLSFARQNLMREHNLVEERYRDDHYHQLMNKKIKCADPMI